MRARDQVQRDGGRGGEDEKSGREGTRVRAQVRGGAEGVGAADGAGVGGGAGMIVAFWVPSHMNS